MGLVRTTFLVAIQTFVRLVGTFVIGKIVSVQLGPAGLGLMGQFQTFMSIVTSLSSGAILTGITRYVSEFKDDLKSTGIYVSTGIRLSAGITAFAILFLVVFANKLSVLILSNNKYSYLFYMLALTISLFVINNFCLAILNGKGEVRKYVFVNIIHTIVSFSILIVLVFFYKMPGLLIGLVIGQSFTVFLSMYFVVQSPWFSKKYLTSVVSTQALKGLAKYMAMSAISILTVPMSYLIVRRYIAHTLGWELAGIWEAAWRLADIYISLIISTLTIYYLPKLSVLKGAENIFREVRKVYAFVLPLVVFGALIIFIFRANIILLLFDETFYKAIPLVGIQLLGSVLKVASWVLGYILVAKSMMKMFVFTEILFSLSFTIFALIFIEVFGLIGATYAYTLTYFLYLIGMIYLFFIRSVLRKV